MSDHRPVDVALENRLMGHGIYVAAVMRLPTDDGASADESVAERDTDADHESVRDGTGLALEYETIAETDHVDSNEVGVVVRTFLEIADERDWEPGRLEVTSRSTDGDLRGRWHVERAWFDALGTDLDQLEFSQRVLETIRIADDEDGE